jgi:glutamine amidotransferase
MKKEKVVVVDYGLGNLFSVQRALAHCGASNVCISSAIDDVVSADRLVLPGVGAFADGIRGLKSLDLVEPIKNHARSKKPFLGICLGMQLLATTSQEFGSHVGLNLIPGNVLPIAAENPEGARRKVPFIGWAKLLPSAKIRSEDLLINEVYKDQSVYLVHSYYFRPYNIEYVLATYEYQGENITAAVRSENVYGFQFHPEKSGEVGLGMLRAFLQV